MFRFTIRELLLVMVVVSLTTVLVLEHWVFRAPDRFSQRDIDVYGAALRHELVCHSSDGLIFVSLADQDPPLKFTGHAAIAASQAHIAVGPKSLHAKHFPSLRYRALSDGSPGVLFALRIKRWIAPDCVEVTCDVLVSDNVGWREIIILRLKDGNWQYDSTSDAGDI